MRAKTALVTGITGGLGSHLGKLLKAASYTVIGTSRCPELISDEYLPIGLDCSDDNSIETAASQILAQSPSIDLIIHNAGIAYYSPVDSLTLEEARHLFDVNFFGPFRLTQLLLPAMQKQAKGCVVFVSTIRVGLPCRFMGMYSASKAALEAMAQDLHSSLKPWNIDVMVVRPGALDTGIPLREGSYFGTSNPYVSVPAEDPPPLQAPIDAAKHILSSINASNRAFLSYTVDQDPAPGGE